MEIKTLSAEIYTLRDYDASTIERYFGEVHLEIRNEYQVFGGTESQIINLYLLLCNDGSLDFDQPQTESRIKDGCDEPYYMTELTTAQFDQIIQLDDVKREIALFGHELAA